VTAALEAPRAGRTPGRAPASTASESRLWTAALAVAMVVAAALVLHAGRGTSFWFDEWNWIQDRRGWTLDALLAPHNQHLSLLPVLVFKLGFATVGLKSYLPYRLVLLALHLLTAGLLFAYARPRAGGALAFAAATVLLFLGTGWMDIVWAFQIGYVGSLAAGLGALLALDRGTRRGDLVAALLLTASLASSSLGLPVWAMAAVDVLARDGRAKRLPVLAVPAVLYLLWYAAYGSGGDARLANVLQAPGFMADMAAGAAGALAGLGSDWGRPLALAIGALVAWRALTAAGRPWRLVALVVLPLAFWGLTALARAQFHEPAAPRYLYPGALFVLLVGAEAARGLRVTSRRAFVLGSVVLAAITVANGGALLDGGGYLRDEASAVRGGLAAVQETGVAVPAGFQPAATDAPQITVGGYRAAARDLGAPDLPRDPAADDRNARAAADATLIRAGEVSAAPAPGVTAPGPAPAVEQATGATAAADAGCVLATATTAPATVTVAPPAGGLVVTPLPGGTATIAARRWGDGYGPALTTVASGAREAVTVRQDALPAPWHVQLTLTGAVRVCGGRP
jgi:hypothetical protein